MDASAERGFTLMEVVAALAVLALALTAGVKLASQQAGAVAFLRDKTLAEWVAVNELTRIQLEPAWPDVGDRRGRSVMAGREWPWWVSVADTPDPGVRRLEVRVGDADSPTASVTGYVANMESPPG